MSVITGIEEAIEVFGGLQATAQVVGRSTPTICQWRSRHGRFPAEYYLIVSAALQRLHHSNRPDSLFTFRLPAAEPPPKRKKPRRKPQPRKKTRAKRK